MITTVTGAIWEVFSLIWLVINFSLDKYQVKVISDESSSPFKTTTRKTQLKSNEDSEESWGQFVDLSEDSSYRHVGLHSR